MKTSIKITTLLLAAMAISSCKEEAKEPATTDQAESIVANDATEMVKLEFTDDSAREQFQHYIHIKTALVNSNAAEAQSGAQMLIGSTDDDALKNTLSQISESDDIEVQRTAFSDLTEQMTAMVNASLSSGAVYKQFCPMAFNNEGGYWLSTEEEIRNPYYGDRMLKCGRVAETLGSN